MQLDKKGVLLLRGLDSKISKNLPSDLRKLKCKVSSIHLKFMAMRLQLHILLFGLTLKLGDIIDVLGGFPCVEIFASDLGTWKQVCRENAEEGALHCFSLARGERCEGDDWLPVRFMPPVYNERKMHPELLKDQLCPTMSANWPVFAPLNALEVAR